MNGEFMKKLIIGFALLASVSAYASDKNCGKVVAVSGDEISYQVAIMHQDGSFRVGISPNLVALATSALAASLDVCVNADYFINSKGVVYMNVMNKNTNSNPLVYPGAAPYSMGLPIGY